MYFDSHAVTYMKTQNAGEEQQKKEKCSEIHHESVQLAFVPKSTTDPIDRYRGGAFFVKFREMCRRRWQSFLKVDAQHSRRLKGDLSTKIGCIYSLS